MMGSALHAVLWTCLAMALLVGWSGLLATLRPRLVGRCDLPGERDLAAWRARWREPDRTGWRDLGAWGALVSFLAILPLAPGGVAADLDAGLLWLFVLASLARAMADGIDPDGRRDEAATAWTLVLATAPVVLRVASLNLTDIVVAQQGGVGSWFVVRDPFTVVAAAAAMLTIAARWQAGGDEPPSVLGAVTAAGAPLVAAIALGVLFLGGWWSFVPFLDGAPWLNTLLKGVVVYAGLLWLRSHPRWLARRVVRRLPVVALATALGSLLWMVWSGGVR